MRRYADCIYCGGPVKERRVQREIRWKGRLYVVENVPVGLCGQCGEKFLKPAVAKALDAVLEKGEPVGQLQIPVLSYDSV